MFLFKPSNPISLIYYGFAVFAAFSNICFSYARILEHKGEQDFLRSTGERFFLTACGFLIGSLLQYVAFNNSLFVHHQAFQLFVNKVCQTSGSLFLLGTLIPAGVTMHALLEHLFEKTSLNQANYHVDDIQKLDSSVGKVAVPNPDQDNSETNTNAKQ